MWARTLGSSLQSVRLGGPLHHPHNGIGTDAVASRHGPPIAGNASHTRGALVPGAGCGCLSACPLRYQRNNQSSTRWTHCPHFLDSPGLGALCQPTKEPSCHSERHDNTSRFWTLCSAIAILHARYPRRHPVQSEPRHLATPRAGIGVILASKTWQPAGESPRNLIHWSMF